AYGGLSGSLAGTVGCDVVARFENNVSTGPTPATWTAYTGGDTTWTVEVTDNVVYAGGPQRWQNTPGPNSGDKPGDGAVSREGIAALSTVTGLPFSWNPTRARGVGVQDILATNDGLYVGSDTELLGHTTGNTYHARIAYLPLAGGATVPQIQTNALPTNLYRVASGASQLTRRNFTGTTVGTAANAANGPGWGTSTGAFMVNGVLYQAKTDGTLSKMTFDGTTYGTVGSVNTADALLSQAEWHTDVKTLTSLFYSGGFLYYTKSGINALYRRGFEVESGVIGQQRFSTTTTGINYANVRGAFVAGGKLYYASNTGNLYSATWNQAGHAATAGTVSQITTAGTGWSTRAMFPYQGVPAAANEPPVANASISCNAKVCTFDGTASSDAEGPLTYDWDFGDGTSHGSGATTTHTYADAGDRAVTLTVTDNKGATNAVTRTASPTNQADSISFVNRANNNGSRSSHTIAVPAGTQVGDTLLLFFASNSTGPVYAGPAGWTEIESENGTSFVGRAYTKTATVDDIGATPATPGANVTVTSKNADGTAYTVKSDLTIATYRGVGSPAVGGANSTSQSFPSTVHQTPTIDAEDGTSWLLSYWTDKSSTATGVPTNWTGPGSQTQRSEGTANGSNHMSSLLTDSNARVGKGVQGGLNATADVSAQALTMSILLEGKGEAPANQAPVSNPVLSSCTGLTCTFDGTSSFDTDGGSLTYDWDWGDGTTHGTTSTPSHTFGSGGSKTVTLTVSDGQGGSNSDTVTATPVDPPANTAPTAAITGVSCNGLSCSFDGSTSDDPDSDTLLYSWDFGDGTGTSTTANPTYVYPSAGQRTVELTVDDQHGHTDEATVVVNPQVANAAPTVDITAVTCTDLSCSFTTTASDPDNDTLTYSWDFGDTTGTSTEANPTYAYTTAGAKNVTVSVSDGAGHTATDTATANPTDPGGDPVSNIAFVGTASSVGNSTSRVVTVPTAVEAGDTLVMFIGSASSGRTFTAPAGWNLLESKDGASAMGVRAWTKTATATDAANAPTGVKVTVGISTTTKADLTLAAYRNTDAGTPIAASASKIDDGPGAAHTSPAVTAANDTSWLVTYWADRSTTSTGWIAPDGVTVRWPGQPDTSAAH
ncbi:MAG: PKD domain-containing protein, partial [Marmoricola sp.]